MKRFSGLLFIFLMSCAYCQDKSISTEWRKWQDSLRLAQPEEIDCKIQLEKSIFSQSEPVLLRFFIINKTAGTITFIPPYNRIVALERGSLGFKILSEDNTEYPYQTGFHADGILLPGDEKMVGPYDSLYINVILWPNNFYDFGKRYERVHRKAFPPGQYRLYGRIYLGTKFYPKPARGLILVSDTVLFTIAPNNPDEQNLLTAIDPLISAFFYKLEEILLVSDNTLRRITLPTLLPLFDDIKNRNSNMAPLIDFVSIRIRASIDSGNIGKVITDAKTFISTYKGSILAEEMEFILSEILYRKEKRSAMFIKEANRIIAEYPKNINTFMLIDWLMLPHSPKFDFYKGLFLH